MEKTIKHIHGVGTKTILNITLVVLYILERVTLKECIYSILTYILVIVLSQKLLDWFLEKTNEKLKQLEDNGRNK